MKIILAGKHELACKMLDLLIKKPNHDIGFVTSKTENELHSERDALKRKLKDYELIPLNSNYSHDELLRVVKNFEPDLLISAGFDKIIKREVIDSVPYCINIHFGLLPRYRGSLSIPWAIINNEQFIGVTLHKISTGIDDGNILVQEKLLNEPQQSCKELYLRAVDIGVKSIIKYIPDVEQGSIGIFEGTVQSEADATYYSPQYPNNYKVNWRQTFIYVYNYIRASYFPPYAPTYTVMGGEPVGIEFPVRWLAQKGITSSGKIIEHDGQFLVTTLNGLIQPLFVLSRGVRCGFQEYVTNNALSGKSFDYD